MDTPARHRAIAALLSLAAMGTLVLQTGVDLASGQAFGPSLWDQALYFTNLTVAWVAGICGWVTLRGWPQGAGRASWPGGLTVWIVLVGVVYHALLAADHNPKGWDVLVNIFQHTAIPVAVLAFWIACAPKSLFLKDPLIWTAWPLVYALYALARGLTGPKFPYFFLDPVKTGWPGVGLYILGLGLLFYLAGLGLFAVARRLNRG